MALIIFDWDDTLCPTTWLYDKDMVAKSGPITREQHEWLHVMSAHQVHIEYRVDLRTRDDPYKRLARMGPLLCKTLFSRL